MYLRSSELQTINGKNYLRIYLEKEYSYIVKHNGEDIVLNNILLEEPDSNDIQKLRELSTSIETLVTYVTAIKPLKISSYLRSETLDTLLQHNVEQNQEETENDEEKIENFELTKNNKVKIFLQDLFAKSLDFKDNTSEYFVELQKFINFIDQKLYRELEDGIPLKTSINVFSKYLGDSDIIYKHIVIEYLCFFFAHLRSDSLKQVVHMEDQKFIILYLN